MDALNLERGAIDNVLGVHRRIGGSTRWNGAGRDVLSDSADFESSRSLLC